MRLVSSRLLFQTIKRNYSGDIALPQCDFVPKQYQGPPLRSLIKVRQTRLNPSITSHFSQPIAVHQGYKQWLFDIEGKRYLDMYGGICTVSVGHSHPKITEAVTEQISTLGHVANIYYHSKIHEYAERLTDTFPGNLKNVYFVNSGTEANDLAIMLARVYTQNYEIIALRYCYHGMNSQLMNLTATSLYKHNIPSAAGFHHAMNPDVYRGLWGGKYCRDSPVQTTRLCNCTPTECEASKNYLAQLREVYDSNIPRKHVAAFFAESIQGVGGTIQFPKGYLKGAYDLVKEYGGLFISDEVQSGFGRTGEHFWAFQMHGITPDIVTLAKGIGNGFPMAAVVTTPEIAQSFTQSDYISTFGGNPVACAAGIAVLDVIKDERLQHNSRVIGTYLLEKLKELRDIFPVIGDVRGKGLMIGVELVAGDKTNMPLDRPRVMKYWDRCRDLGLLLGKGGYNGNVLRIKPPMCITKEDADFTFAVMKKALEEVF